MAVKDKVVNLETLKASQDFVDNKVSDLKSAIGNNLAGTRIGKKYPVHLLRGDYITVSTSDGSDFPEKASDQLIKLHYYRLNKTHMGRWSLDSDDYGNSRTININPELDDDVYWLSFEYGSNDSGPFVETDIDMPIPYMVNIGRTAEAYHPWFEQPQVRALHDEADKNTADIASLAAKDHALQLYGGNKYSGLASMSANYFDADTAEWTDGIMVADGSVTESDQHEYAYCPLQGPGTYITLCNRVTYGDIAYKLILADEERKFVKSLTAIENNTGHASKYTLTADDYKSAKYAVMQRKKSGTIVPKLYYNPANETMTDYTQYQNYAIKPDVRSTADPLYKKVVVCDGDSISAGSYDQPKNWGAWWGRLRAHYQVSGHNYSVGGASITQDTRVHVITTSIDTIHNDYPTLDYLILEGGTNDPHYSQSAQGEIAGNFGTFTDSDFSGNYDISTFCGAVENLFYKAVTYYPNAKIGFIVYLATTTSKASYADRERYFDKIIEIAQKWHIPVLDLRKVCHATPRLSAYYDSSMTGDQAVAAKKFFYDKQHPTSYGYDLMQPIIEAWMKTL